MSRVSLGRSFRRNRRFLAGVAVIATIAAGGSLARVSAQGRRTLGAPFERLVLAAALPEAPFPLRFFATPVKTDAQGRVITGPDNSGTVKDLVGAEPAGVRAGLQRYTKIMFSASYDDGRPKDRLTPDHQQVSSGNAHWPFVKQPFRSWPNALALTPNGAKLYVTLPGREGYPDWRLAVVDTARRTVTRWIDLRPTPQAKGTRPTALQVSPANAAIYPVPYAIVL